MIQALLPAVLPLVKDAVGAFLPEDKNKRAEAERKIEAELTTHLAKIDLAQIWPVRGFRRTGDGDH